MLTGGIVNGPIAAGVMSMICFPSARRAKSDLGLGARLDKAVIVNIDRLALHPHSIRQKSKVRLVYAEHVLDRFGGDPNLLTDQLLAVALAQFEIASEIA
jgi:hypothetical protein